MGPVGVVKVEAFHGIFSVWTLGVGDAFNCNVRSICNKVRTVDLRVVAPSI